VAKVASTTAAMDGCPYHANDVSFVVPIAPSSGAQKLGQPVPLSNLVVEENRSRSQPSADECAAPFLVQKRARERTLSIALT